MLFTILITLIVLYLIARFFLSGPDLSMYDPPRGQYFAVHDEDNEATKRFIEILRDVRKSTLATRSPFAAIQNIRDFADGLSDDLVTDTKFHKAVANGVDCEWAVRSDSDHSKRVLLLHGGAFLFGSPKGHRKLSDQLAKISKGVVLSVDYRMLPKHGRFASVLDAQSAYKWVLENGPESNQPASKLLVAGDSAGGNLALMLSAWSKTQADRQPDAVIGFSPSLDMTFASPTIKQFQRSDKMLGPLLGLVNKLPMAVRAWVGLLFLRCNPANPLVSPLFQDLSGLPPTLIQASSNEVLLGEAIRYANKADVSGSSVKLQIWENQIHDWHLMNLGYGSANAAWNEVERFLKDTHFI